MEHQASVDVDVPVRTAYDQWTQFEDFPLFMDHVEVIEQIDPTHLRWKAKVFGISQEWTAEITEQSPDQRIAWTATDGTKNHGVVTFHALSDDQTRVMLQLEVEPKGLIEKVGDWGGFVADRARKDLRDFKSFIEQRGHATGAWRGEVDRPQNRAETKRREELSDMSKDELLDLASEQNVENRSHMTRAELIDELV